MDFSIIIPAKNEAANIGACLDSIAWLDYDKALFEVLVIDNGSTDDTVALAKARGATVYQQPNLTISALRNFGAAQSLGRVLAFIDADCTVAGSWLSEAARYLDTTDIACFGSPPVVPEKATWVQQAWFNVRRKTPGVGETAWLESMNMFIPTNIFKDIGGFNESLVTCEDYDLSLRLGAVGRLISDEGIQAVHHGEAATVRHFIRKEFWRGVSNFAGIRRHGLTAKEIPSLIAPSLHCLLVLAICAVPIIPWPGLQFLTICTFLAWQGLLLVASIRKSGKATTAVRIFQLFWLLNIYLAVRGLAVFRRR